MVINKQKQSRLKLNTALIFLVVFSILGILLHTFNIMIFNRFESLEPEGIQMTIQDPGAIYQIQAWLVISGLLHLFILFKSIHGLFNRQSINRTLLWTILLSCMFILINTFYYPAYVLGWLWLIFLVVYLFSLLVLKNEIQ